MNGNDASIKDGPLFLVPLAVESFAVRRGARGARVERLGMGPSRAITSRVRVEAEPVAPVVIIGFGGALVPGLRPGDVVVGTSLVTMTGGGESKTPSAPNASSVVELDELGIAARLRSAGLTVHEERIVSSPSVVRSDVERGRAAATGAVAVDMESFWCAPLARARPFAVVRVIIDVPGRALVSPATLLAGMRALRSLTAASRALAAWAPASFNGNPLQEVGDR